MQETRLSWLISKDPLSRRESSDSRLSIDLRKDVGQGLSNTISTFQLQVVHVHFNGLAKDRVSPFHLTKAFMSLARSYFVADAMLIGPVHELIAQPATSFVGDELLWRAEVCNPVSLKGLDVVLRLL